LPTIQLSKIRLKQSIFFYRQIYSDKLLKSILTKIEIVL
jgi:hypothetical protein